jgi:hypothetical protein
MTRRLVASLVSIAVGSALFARATTARAQDTGGGGEPNGAAPIAPAQVDLEKDVKPTGAEAEAPPPEAPPPPPYKKTLVLDSSIGALSFIGQFGKVAPTAPWLHTQLGYELLPWLMVFGEGELAFTDTSGTQQPPKTRAFPILGFGGGARFTLRFTDRFGVYAQAGVGAMKADVAKRSLAILGFGDAESFGLYAAARAGVEWYQLDRHFALGLNFGIRQARGFAKSGGATDNALALDGGAALRYAF